MNKMELLGGIFNGLNMNPIPLEFSQEMTTTKILASLLNKIDNVITFTNNWHETILNDLQGGGELYSALTSEIIQPLNIAMGELRQDLDFAIYDKPSVLLYSQPIETLYLEGESINSLILKFNIQSGSNTITKAEIYKNDVLLDTILNVSDGLNTYVDGSIISATTRYKILVYKNTNVIESNELKILFVKKMYYGVNSGDITPTAIKNLTQLKSIPNDISLIFSPNGAYVIFAYPTEYGLLEHINSINQETVDSFSHSTVNIDGINYYVYISPYALYINNLTLNFIFEE